MQDIRVDFHNTTNGVFISLETPEFVLSVKSPGRTKAEAERKLAGLVRRLFKEPEKFIKERR